MIFPPRDCDANTMAIPLHNRMTKGDDRFVVEELVREMMREDLKEAERDDLVRKHGYKAFNRHE